MLDRFTQFKSSPTSTQFARGGSWEHAWSSPVGQLPSHQALASYLALSTEVAFEAFFGDSFFGTRRVGSPLEVEVFSRQCIQAAHARESFFPVFQRELGCPVAGQQAAFAEIGCVNAWRSVGAFQVPDLQAATADFEQLWLRVEESAVGHDSRHVKAIEFAFERPVPHWFGIPVSSPSGSNRVCKHLLGHALGLAASR